jgi:trimeric autotransporter adhesin
MKTKALSIFASLLILIAGSDAAWAIHESDTNTWLGNRAGNLSITGTSNTFIGDLAGNNDAAGSFNTFIGESSGQNNTSGILNTYIGVASGQLNPSGSNNVFIGAGAGNAETGSNKLYIDNCLNPSPSCPSNPLIYGEFDNRIIQVSGTLIMSAVAALSDERFKKNIEPLRSSLDKVLHLQGVSYNWKSEENSDRGFMNRRDIGLIAQSAEAVIPEIVYTDRRGYKALSYDKIVPVLVEAIKEQQREIRGKEVQYETSLKDKDGRIEKLEEALEKMEQRMAALEGVARKFALRWE